MSGAGVRIGAGLAVVLFAALALASGFDRMSEVRVALARFVPAPMQVGAAKRLAAGALSASDLVRATRQARVSVAHDPLDARGLAYLGSARLLAGDGAGAARAFGIARRLGRREPLTRIYFLSEHLQRGRFEAAAAELDALLRAGRSDVAHAQSYFALLEQSDDGRRALADRLTQNPRWAEVYLRAQGTDAAKLRARAAFLADPGNGLDRLGCAATLPMIRELARKNFRREAEGLAARHCARVAGKGLIADAEFVHFGDEEAGVLGWRRFSTGDVRVTRLAGDRARLELENRSSVTRPVLAQPIAARAGSLLLRAKVDGPGGERLRASIACGAFARPNSSRRRIDRDGLVLAAPACEDQLLTLWLRPGTGRVVIDSVNLGEVPR